DDLGIGQNVHERRRLLIELGINGHSFGSFTHCIARLRNASGADDGSYMLAVEGSPKIARLEAVDDLDLANVTAVAHVLDHLLFQDQ
ncbi:hypothetical protein DF186_18495, partial [Enterococcus hirae]